VRTVAKKREVSYKNYARIFVSYLGEHIATPEHVGDGRFNVDVCFTSFLKLKGGFCFNSTRRSLDL